MRAALTICPSTVAAAAPATSMRGKGPRPKISTGSMTMFTMAPAPWLIMVQKVRPVDWSRRSNMMAIKMPKHRAEQMEI